MGYQYESEGGGGWNIGRILGCLVMALLIVGLIVAVFLGGGANILGRFLPTPAVAPVPPAAVVTQPTRVVRPTTVPPAVEPTKVVPVAPTKAPGAAVEPTIAPAEVPEQAKLRCIIANYPGYYIASLIEGWYDGKWGFELEVAPMASGPDGTDYDFSEPKQADLIRTGEYDCLFTTIDTVALRGAYGQITAVTDESAGADLVGANEPNLKFNDLVGQPIAVALGSVSEHFTIPLFRIIGENPADPTVRVLLPQVKNAEQAVKEFKAGNAKAVVAWVPVIWADEEGNLYDVKGNHIGYKVIGSERIPIIADAIFFSYQAITEKHEAVQAFHYAYYEALKDMFEDPKGAAEKLYEWDAVNYEWTGLQAYAEELGYENAGDALIDYMWGIAQANLQAAYALMQDHADQATLGRKGILARRLDYAREVWAAGGTPTVDFDTIMVVNSEFVLNVVANHPELMTTAPPLYTDRPFAMQGAPVLAPLTEDVIPEADVIASLPKLQFEFIGNSGQLVEADRKPFEDYMRGRVVPALEATSADVGLLCTVGSAWPPGYDAVDLVEFLKYDRIPGVKQLMGTFGAQMNRVVFNSWIPNEKDLGADFTKHKETLDESIRRQDRFLQCELFVLGGR